ncbi:unnamed protein product [Colias eurytheme]|nr:unnamed protein product [Colias eurytheme]
MTTKRTLDYSQHVPRLNHVTMMKIGKSDRGQEHNSFITVELKGEILRMTRSERQHKGCILTTGWRQHRRMRGI